MPHQEFFFCAGGFWCHWPQVLGLPEGTWKIKTAYRGREASTISVPAIVNGCTEGQCPRSHGDKSGRLFKQGQTSSCVTPIIPRN